MQIQNVRTATQVPLTDISRQIILATYLQKCHAPLLKLKPTNGLSMCHEGTVWQNKNISQTIFLNSVASS